MILFFIQFKISSKTSNNSFSPIPEKDIANPIVLILNKNPIKIKNLGLIDHIAGIYHIFQNGDDKLYIGSYDQTYNESFEINRSGRSAVLLYSIRKSATSAPSFPPLTQNNDIF